MLSILIPSKNEPRILETLLAVEEHFPMAQVIIATDREGKGKGWAMREALSQATSEIICFLDGDMDIHPKMIWRLLPFIEDYDIVVGKKEVKGILSRRIITFLSRIYIRLLFGIKVDSQTGIKIFHKSVLPAWQCDSFAFDIEILAKATKFNESIIEVPIEANITKRMKLKSIISCFVESVKIFIALL